MNRNTAIGGYMTKMLRKALYWVIITVLPSKLWAWMTKQERYMFVHQIVSQVRSEQELRRRLDHIGYSGCIDWVDVLPGDRNALLAQVYYRQHGRPVAKNGALVMVNDNW